jgi:hypothetical protein
MKDRANVSANPTASPPTQEEIKKMRIEELKKRMAEISAECNITLTLTGYNLSHTITPIIHTVINPLSNPSFHNIKCTKEMIESFTGCLYNFFMEIIYFNPAARENYSISIIDRKEEIMSYYEGGKWNNITNMNEHNEFGRLLQDVVVPYGRLVIKSLFPTKQGINNLLRQSLEMFEDKPRERAWKGSIYLLSQIECQDVVETHNVLKIEFPSVE